MNTKRYVLAVVAVFVTVFVYEFLVHGVLLMDMYEQTADMWKPQEESSMLLMNFSQLAFAAVLVFIFTRNYEGKGAGEGVRFGLLIGLLLVAIELGVYCYLPVPMALWLAWIVIALGKGIISGLVAGLVYKN